MISPTSTAPAPIFAVVVHEKGGAERRETFETNELTVGRVQGNELMLPKGNVSKRHARLLYRDGRFIVTDLNSTNGTYVNRRRITQATIVREGDRIYVGDFVLRIEIPAGGVEVESDAPNQESARPDLASSPEELSATGPSPAATNQIPRAALEEADERARALGPVNTLSPPPRPPSSPVGSDPPVRPASFPVHETTGTHQVGRTTQDDSPSYERQALSGVLSQIVQAVFDRIGAQALSPPMAPDLGARIEPFLREAVTKVSSSKEAPISMAPERLRELARDELLDLGPLGDLLSDAAVSDIGVVRFDQIVATRGGRAVSVEPGFSSEEALEWTIARLRADAIEGSTAHELRLSGGARVSLAAGANGQPASLMIRKSGRLGLTIDELVRRGVISRAMATFFRHCLANRVNVLVVGGRDGSPEQVLSALSETRNDARSVLVGDGLPGGLGPSEVAVDFGLSSLDEARRALSVKAAMPGVRISARLMTPAVSAAVTELIGSGVDGVLAVRYATSTRRALLRLAAEIAMARPGLDIRAARELVAGTFDVVIEVARLRDDRVRVLRVSELSGVEGEEIACQDIFSFVPDRTAAGGAVEGTFVASEQAPQLLESLRARGESLDSSVFSRPPSR